MTDKFIGAFIELTPSEEEEGIDLRFGWEFPDNMDPDIEDTFKSLVAGIFGLMSSQEQQIIAIGEIVRNISAFDDSIHSVGDTEIVFTADDALMDELDNSATVIDINKFKPQGSVH